MIKNEEFTKNHLDKIIVASEKHTIDEWLVAFKKLSETMSELNLDIHSMDAESLKLNLAENESQIISGVKRFDFCAESILNSSIKLVQASSKKSLQYDDVSELIRSAWWELISLFDYSPNLYLDIYALCFFNNLALALEKSVKIVADKLSV